MAKKEKVNDSKLYKNKKQYESDLEAYNKYTAEWDSVEAMLVSKTFDSVSKQTKNSITDSDASTMLIERSARVVGQLPSGVTEAAGKKDRGKAALMDLIRERYIYPNANAQRPFLEKIRLWEMYSGVYGVSLMYYDWDVAPDGYIGPNCWLWNPRNFIPQQGKYSIEDMDYAHAISWITKAEIESIIKRAEDEDFSSDSGWDFEALEELLTVVDNSEKSSDNNRDTYTQRAYEDGAKGRVQIVTRFEAGDDGRWITFAPDFNGLQLRDILNPHKNGHIPFISKSGIQLADSFTGISDLQRAKPIQAAKDGLINYYFQGIKMNIYPPTVVNSQGIVKHTVSNEPGAIWEEIMPNSVRRLETSTAGLSTYQAAMGQMSGAIQNVFGTTTTQSNAESAMSSHFGRTPQALKMQSERESSRDNQNRALLQSAIEKLMDRFMELIVNVGTERFEVSLFSKDIEGLVKQGYQDVLEMIIPNESGETGTIFINPESLKGVSYRFNMKADSTIKITKKEQKEDLLEFIGVLAQHQNELQTIYQQTGKMVDWSQIINTYAELADLPGIEDVFVQGEKPEDDKPDPVLELIQKMSIRFADMPEDVKGQILQALGLQPGDASPKEKDLQIKETDAETRRLQATGNGLPSFGIGPQEPEGFTPLGAGMQDLLPPTEGAPMDPQIGAALQELDGQV